jgi:hypothetical protein
MKVNIGFGFSAGFKGVGDASGAGMGTGIVFRIWRPDWARAVKADPKAMVTAKQTTKTRTRDKPFDILVLSQK